MEGTNRTKSKVALGGAPSWRKQRGATKSHSCL